jgi:predicted nucleotide-binding protein (sugar kinase/HSP70/actin superfamily)
VSWQRLAKLMKVKWTTIANQSNRILQRLFKENDEIDLVLAPLQYKPKKKINPEIIDHLTDQDTLQRLGGASLKEIAADANKIFC